MSFIPTRGEPSVVLCPPQQEISARNRKDKLRMHMVSMNNGPTVRGMKESKGRETHTSILSLCPHPTTACRTLNGLLGSRHEHRTFFFFFSNEFLKFQYSMNFITSKFKVGLYYLALFLSKWPCTQGDNFDLKRVSHFKFSTNGTHKDPTRLILFEDYLPELEVML